MRENGEDLNAPTNATLVAKSSVKEKEYNFFAPTQNDLPEDVHLAVYGESEIELEAEEADDEETEEVQEEPHSNYRYLAFSSGISAITGIGSLILLTVAYFAWYFEAGSLGASMCFVIGAVLAAASVMIGKSAIFDDYLDIEGTMTKWQVSIVASAMIIPILGIFFFSAPALEKQISIWHQNYEYRVNPKSHSKTVEEIEYQAWVDSMKYDTPFLPTIKQQSKKTIPTRPRRTDIKTIGPFGKSDPFR